MDENIEHPPSTPLRLLSDLNIPQDVLVLILEREISKLKALLIFKWDNEACQHFIDLLNSEQNDNDVDPPNAFDRFAQQPTVSNPATSID